MGERIGFEERLRRCRRGPDDCWIWPGAILKAGKGYGVFRRDGKLLYAHRASYELLVGPIPKEFELDHTCPSTRCINPNHLEPVTHAENMRRYGERRTHCAKGHELAVVGVYIKPSDGSRQCIACRKDNWAKHSPGICKRRKRERAKHRT